MSIGAADRAVPVTSGLPPAKPWLAFVIALISAPVAFLYVGRLRHAILLFLLPFVVLSLAGWTGAVFSARGFFLMLALVLGIFLVSLFWPFLIARRRKVGLRTAVYHRIWIYLLSYVVFTATTWFVMQHRAQLFGWEPFRVPSGSMLHTIEVGEFILADARSGRSPTIGDLLIYAHGAENPAPFIKRIVGLPRDRIAFRDCKVIRNGVALSEPYVLIDSEDASPDAQRMCNFAELTLGQDEIFLLGDNRLHSADSRAYGPSRLSDIKARARFIWFSRDLHRVGQRLD
ncbi:MAG: signal peptidase I [Stagnimonas sp.]|nr:signal peptidase I [Stagnimonas sp.]